jgi:DNA helicase II / ATP-dependent DNA helicase PcrA
MTHDAALSPEAEAMLREEESLLARALGAIARARRDRDAAERAPAREGLRSADALRALREEAASACEDDLPALLLEMSVRQRLRERPAEPPLPDPASPYLAHLRVRDDQEIRDYLLGHASFLDAESGVRIVDWRVAPVAKIFYRHREGDDYEEAFAGRAAEGTVLSRRVVVVSEGELLQILSDDCVLSRAPGGRWRSEPRSSVAFAEGGAGTAARPGMLGVGAGLADRVKADVTALLDADQFAAVTAPAEQPLLVLGSAGSGKTTVALHRLARIAAADGGRYPLSRMRLVVPEEGLARLSRKLLAPLGAGEALVQTLDMWAIDLARRVFGDSMPRKIVEAPALVSGLKRHPALYRALRERAGKLAGKGGALKGMRKRLAELFTDRGFLEGVVEDSKGGLSRAAVEETVRHTMLQIADSVDKQLRSIVVAEMKQAVDGRPIEEGTPEELAGTVDVEELPILLFLRGYKDGLGDEAGESIGHLVLDEAEDFSLFELDVLGKLLGEEPSVTLAGDEAQQTSSGFAGWEEALATLGMRTIRVGEGKGDGAGKAEVAICRLAISYRCPQPVVDLARRILGAGAGEERGRAARAGAPVGVFEFPGAA